MIKRYRTKFAILIFTTSHKAEWIFACGCLVLLILNVTLGWRYMVNCLFSGYNDSFIASLTQHSNYIICQILADILSVGGRRWKSTNLTFLNKFFGFQTWKCILFLFFNILRMFWFVIQTLQYCSIIVIFRVGIRWGWHESGNANDDNRMHLCCLTTLDGVMWEVWFANFTKDHKHTGLAYVHPYRVISKLTTATQWALMIWSMRLWLHHSTDIHASSLEMVFNFIFIDTRLVSFFPGIYGFVEQQSVVKCLSLVPIYIHVPTIYLYCNVT